MENSRTSPCPRRNDRAVVPETPHLNESHVCSVGLVVFEGALLSPLCGAQPNTRQELESCYFPVLCDGVTLEVPPLEKGARGIFKALFPLNTPLLAAGIFFLSFP